MSETPNPYPHKPPFKTLGKYLKTMRQKLHESLGETSGAVEIDVEKLDGYERGAEAPSKDILLLLISHFGLHEDEAVRLWELAGYDRDDGLLSDTAVDDALFRPVQLTVFAIDNRVLYSNGVEVVADNNGVVLNFTQSTGNVHHPISRIGMSYEHAEKVLHALEQTMLRKKYLSGPKSLPSPKSLSRPKPVRDKETKNPQQDT